MIEMTQLMADLLDKALADGTACLVGTASKDGKPQISPRGSVAVLNPKQLCFWERSWRTSLTQLKDNPHVVIYYRNPARAAEMPAFKGATLRFHGKARIVESGPERDAVWAKTIPAEQGKDPEKKGVGIVVDVELIEDLLGTVVMKRD